jgi:hypothetical protein
MSNFFFFVGLALILVHEMDAITCSEWRIFPGLSVLPEKTAYLVFMVLHIPLYYLLVSNLYSANQLNTGFIRGLDIFFVVHVFAHILFLKHPKNQFKSNLSWMIISGCGVAGFLDLIVGF